MTHRSLIPLACLFALAAAAAPAGDTPRYANDFAKAAPGKLDEKEFLVLAGRFEVKEADGERFVELSPHPMESYGLLFGPPGGATGGASARVWGATTGRRFPEFGLGTNDAGGYKLWLMPRMKRLAIRKADATVATAPYDGWQSGTWTHFRLAVTKAGEGAWRIQGKVWPGGTEEPKDWTVSFDDTAEPPTGRASVWANPYSDEPIRFDDLAVTP